MKTQLYQYIAARSKAPRAVNERIACGLPHLCAKIDKRKRLHSKKKRNEKKKKKVKISL
jgi:hypothetical protein